VPGEPLTLTEQREFNRLRRLELPSTVPPSREDLDRLRAALHRELDEIRVRTAQFSCSPDVDELDELRWRRQLPKAKTDEEVRAEAARIEAAAREETARRKSAWRATQHDTLNAIESEVYARILRDERYNDTGDEDPSDKLIFSMGGDCGKKHWSMLRAIACSLVRSEEARRVEARKPRPASTSVSARPARLERPLGNAFPSAPRALIRTSTSARPASTNLAPCGTSAPTQTSTPARPASASSAPNGTATPTRISTPAPPSSAPLGRPPVSPSTPRVIDRAAALERRILDAVSSQDLGSYRAILGAVGGRRAVALAAIQAMHDDGRIALDGGVFRPREQSGKRVPRRG
jgi:hypothetical protein